MDHHEGLAGQVGALAPDFVLPTLEGEPFSLRALRGRWTILFTWASW